MPSKRLGGKTGAVFMTPGGYLAPSSGMYCTGRMLHTGDRNIKSQSPYGPKNTLLNGVEQKLLRKLSLSAT